MRRPWRRGSGVRQRRSTRGTFFLVRAAEPDVISLIRQASLLLSFPPSNTSLHPFLLHLCLTAGKINASSCQRRLGSRRICLTHGILKLQFVRSIYVSLQWPAPFLRRHQGGARLPPSDR